MPVIFVMNIKINILREGFEMKCSMMDRGGEEVCDLLLKISVFLNHKNEGSHLNFLDKKVFVQPNLSVRFSQILLDDLHPFQ